MATNEGKTAYGECRCCLARGHHRELQEEYYFNGIREVYSEIFLDIFNLTLSTNKHLSTLICTTCIQRLRDATSFRMMVVSTENQLLDSINNREKLTIYINSLSDDDTQDGIVDVKLETEVKEETKDSEVAEVNEDCESEFVSENAFRDRVPACTPEVVTLGPSQDLVVETQASQRKPSNIEENAVIDRVPDHASDIQVEETVEGEEALIARFQNVPRLPTKFSLPLLCPDFSKHLESLKGVKILPDTLMRFVKDCEIAEEQRTARLQYVTEKLAHIVNATTVLEFSNVTPFRSKSRQGFPCFYCRNVFENIDKLREHSIEHKRPDIIKVLRTYGAECLVVYVDITDLGCKICKKKMQNLNELKYHLINVHKKKMHLEFTDRVIPFKLPENGMYECQICGCNFETFGAIERHMNVHFRNYVCKDCGTGFVTRYRLKVHVKSMHTGGTHPCEVCGKIFSTPQKHKNHVNTVHKMMKRFKCTKCPERFAEYFRRQKHMVQVHGVAPLKYKCNVCDKSFDRRYTLSRHMKRDHLEERDYQCEMCTYKCFTQNELRVHMVKHNGERIYECSVCKKAYARKKTLKEHMRIHNNDRRFACAVCGQAFIQKCSLKGHIKTHHLEFRMH